MTPEIVNSLVAPFLANGVIGVICVGLVFYILKKETSHKAELAGRDALIRELYEARIQEAKVGYEVLKTNEKTLDTFFNALNGRSQK